MNGAGAGRQHSPPTRLWVRAASHVAVWTCVWLAALLVLARGWTPIGDFANIELQAYRTFSAHPPLVGMFSTAGLGIGHPLYDPGPLALWLLAVPVHIDPAHGLIWGSALCWSITLSLAIEALWSAGQWIGCALVALGAVDLLAMAPSLLENLAWNPYFPLPFLVASMTMAYLVARGNFRWWPVLVFTASVAAQTHLFYLLPSAALVLVAPLVGIWAGGRPRRLRWLYGGLAVGGLCWIAPVVQGLGPHSNLAALARGTGGVGTLGLGFGLRMIGDSAGPFPIWLHREPTGFFPDMAFAFGHRPVYGVAVILALTAVSASALVSRHTGLLAAATVSLVVVTGFAASFAMIPTSNLIVVDYLLVLAWPVGLTVWIVAVWAVLALFRATRPRAQFAGAAPPVVTALLAGGLSFAIVHAIPADPNFGTNWTRAEAAEVNQIVGFVEHSTSRKDVDVVLSDSGHVDSYRQTAIGEGVGLRLVLDGRHPGIEGIDPAVTSLPPLLRSPQVHVVTTSDSVGSFAVEPADARG